MADKAVYLHFLDRELGQSVDYNPSSTQVESLLKTLYLGTNSLLYCSYSFLWEFPAFGNAGTLLEQLVEAKHLELTSHYTGREEFREAHERAYRHDAERYPKYFEPELARLIPIGPTTYKPQGATASLEVMLASRASAERAFLGFKEWETEKSLRADLHRALTAREDEAITIAFFKKRIGKASPGVAWLRRAISEDYTRHNQDLLGGDIATGIPGLDYFDKLLARRFPSFDVRILLEVLRLCGLDALVSRPWDSFNTTERAHLIEQRSSIDHFHFVSDSQRLIEAVSSPTGGERIGEEFSKKRSRAINRIAKLQALLGEPSVGIPANWSEMAAARMQAASGHLIKHFPLVAAVLPTRTLAEVLLVVTTTVERDSVLNVFGASGEYATSSQTYTILHQVVGARVCLVQTQMSSLGPGGSMATVIDAIDDLDPKWVIMLGIAFGMNPQEQKLGDVLVSSLLFEYELQRVGAPRAGGPVLMARGPRPPASPTLVSRFEKVISEGLRGSVGMILTGHKLVDNYDFREELRVLAPEAIGGEMEGGGVYSAAYRKNKPWIVVKAISDWADGHKAMDKAQRQRLAARQAALAVHTVLSKGGFT